MNIKIIQGDITTVSTEAIVNAANSSLLGGSGVDGAIHRKGGTAILEACKKIKAAQGKCAVGQAVITTAGKLPAQYVIHTVGPVWNDGGCEKVQLLSQCYENAMKLAINQHSNSIAFPCISTGIYKFPKELAASTAIQTILKFKDQKIIREVTFVCYESVDFEIYNQLIKTL
ncbi:O-acetyl-ADP-ribose deacetylase (regulator of RNase III) [Nonlabens dokdonensis]|uniref:Appr-1-p processing enzyme family protein n=2 Tax=Nonlabens dokdonensis TaxID=328515 RepID=L7W7M8_NONDD|nr:O-acetyl-ADP-ribose deacetylase [Nonlabens dokdonensis]AGC75781.1 Appr-1-p processing enzyme family protein [Nonlabens dokdonensis DSW-6]PZX43463.1 O-acetyl-ADP-ribose deacetylase (regulator of RNase III) [Nonlabens dokdonensis]